MSSLRIQVRTWNRTVRSEHLPLPKISKRIEVGKPKFKETLWYNLRRTIYPAEGGEVSLYYIRQNRCNCHEI
jgi:hypothetical protein